MSWDGERPIGEDGNTRYCANYTCKTCSEWVECPFGFCDGRIGWCNLGEEFTMRDDGDEECWNA